MAEAKPTNIIRLDSKNTTYIIGITPTGHLENLYYGRLLRQGIFLDALYEKHFAAIGVSVAYSESKEELFMDNMCLEVSAPGKGDYRTPSVEVCYENGMKTLDFVYKAHRTMNGKPGVFSELPLSYGTPEECSTVQIELQDKVLPISLLLNYSVFNDSDVITRSVQLCNNTAGDITIKSLASAQLDICDSDWDIVSFDGAWGRERHETIRHLEAGATVLESRTGASSAFHNPCVFLKRPGANPDERDCYAFNLIYSGSHREVIEKTPYGKTRYLTGLNPSSFSWKLAQGERFSTPEAVLTYSHEGTNGASRHFHRFVNTNIVRGNWKYKERPVLCNNWEATYFNFTEKKLQEMAQTAKELGIELFVLDDGWFGARDNDQSSLGDWTVNTRKLPKGLEALSDSIHQEGLMFGLWVEPEMISKESLLFDKHPDWAIIIPGRAPSPSRHQFILDLTRQEVRNYLVNALSDIFKSAKVDYVKWDMNRTFSDLYSHTCRDMGEFEHRYILGLYEILNKLVKAFPNILFESCASGGNRFDLGMLCFMSQTWTSDNTDALCRTQIQQGTSYGYPLSAMGAHVSASPNHQTLRRTDIESRFNVASFGVLGYELDLCALNRSQKEIVKQQVAFYKENRALLQYGRFYRIATDSNSTMWIVTNYDYSEMIVLDFQILNQPNCGTDILRIPLARPDYDYEVIPRQQRVSIRVFGDLINMVSPVHISSEGKLHKLIAENYTFKSEIEHYLVSGDVLAYGGIKLNQQFSGTGYNEHVRVLGDFGSRMYHIVRVEKKA